MGSEQVRRMSEASYGAARCGQHAPGTPLLTADRIRGGRDGGSGGGDASCDGGNDSP
eukprot:gene10147-4366_t